MLEDSPEAVPMTKKGNIPFAKADLATIRGSGPENVFFQMIPKSFLSVLIHSTRSKYDSSDFFSKFLTGNGRLAGQT
jgi:hypothetical protein